jgi:hypothetical protein
VRNSRAADTSPPQCECASGRVDHRGRTSAGSRRNPTEPSRRIRGLTNIGRKTGFWAFVCPGGRPTSSSPGSRTRTRSVTTASGGQDRCRAGSAGAANAGTTSRLRRSGSPLDSESPGSLKEGDRLADCAARGGLAGKTASWCPGALRGRGREREPARPARHGEQVPIGRFLVRWRVVVLVDAPLLGHPTELAETSTGGCRRRPRWWDKPSWRDTRRMTCLIQRHRLV